MNISSGKWEGNGILFCFSKPQTPEYSDQEPNVAAEPEGH